MFENAKDRIEKETGAGKKGWEEEGIKGGEKGGGGGGRRERQAERQTDRHRRKIH